MLTCSVDSIVPPLSGGISVGGRLPGFWLGCGRFSNEPKVSITPRTEPGSREEGETRQANIRIDSTLVLINVTVTTPLNQVVTGLEKDHFRLFEDKIEQTVSQFSSEDAPFSVGLVFDISGSMGSKVQKARQGAGQFFKTANPEDEFFLIQFNDRPQLSMPFTARPKRSRTGSHSRIPKDVLPYLTPLPCDGSHEKSQESAQGGPGLSDGGDNSSRYTQSEIKNLVREADVQVYAIGIFEPVAARGRTAEELGGPSLLSELAEQTGGRHFPVENVNELPDVAAKIGIELRNQYVLGYSPAINRGMENIDVSRSNWYSHGDCRRFERPSGAGTMRRFNSIALVTALLSLIAIPLLVSQEKSDAVFRTETRLVVLHASVVDKDGKLVTDLPKEAFNVFENDVKQDLRVFRREDVPVSMGLVIDNSGSMRDKRRDVEAAALRWSRNPILTMRSSLSISTMKPILMSTSPAT